MQILFFGNPLIEKDALILKIIPRLREKFFEIEFLETDPTEDLTKSGRNLKIIDVVEGINEVRLLSLNNLKNFDKLIINNVFSMHDFDLGYNLKLLKKLNLINSVKIICIPINMDEEEAFSQTQLILRKFVAHDIQGS